MFVKGPFFDHSLPMVRCMILKVTQLCLCLPGSRIFPSTAWIKSRDGLEVCRTAGGRFFHRINKIETTKFGKSALFCKQLGKTRINCYPYWLTVDGESAINWSSCSDQQFHHYDNWLCTQQIIKTVGVMNIDPVSPWCPATLRSHYIWPFCFTCSVPEASPGFQISPAICAQRWQSLTIKGKKKLEKDIQQMKIQSGPHGSMAYRYHIMVGSVRMSSKPFSDHASLCGNWGGKGHQ